jgi:hypothetical protein
MINNRYCRNRHLGDRECGDPDGLLDGVDANVSVAAYVGVENFGEEAHLRRMERIGERHLRQAEKISLI